MNKMASCQLLSSTRGACSRSGRRGLEWIPSQSPLVVTVERSFVPIRSGCTTTTIRSTGTGSCVRRCSSNNKSLGTLSSFSSRAKTINWTPAFARRKATSSDEQDYDYSSAVLMSALGVALAASTFYNSLPSSNTTTHCSAVDPSPTPLATSSSMMLDGPLATDQPHPSTLLTFEKPTPSHHNQFKKAKRVARVSGEPYDVSLGLDSEEFSDRLYVLNAQRILLIWENYFYISRRTC